MYVAGDWRGGGETSEVRSPYSDDVIGEVPIASAEDVEQALAASVEGARAMASLGAHERGGILERAAQIIEVQVEELARTITLEEGKPLAEARGEASRSPALLRLCAEEGARSHGETLPLDAVAGGDGKLGFTLRQPCGVVVAITPFNYPMLLVLHKIGPALAAGNAVILKPASQTPLTALRLTEILLEAGLPENALQCLTGPGGSLGAQLCADRRVRKISFTGSTAVGEAITRTAGIKRLSLELGANCPLIVLADADVGAVARATAVGGYVNAGQVCISVQRVIADRAVYPDLLDSLKTEVASITVGNPLEPSTKLSAVITEADAERIEGAVRNAVHDGAQLVTGGERSGAVLAPMIVADVQPGMALFEDELFGPAVAVSPASGIDEAIELANASRYGLSAGLFTSDLHHALRFAREVECGNVMINSTPLWRADLMPYGGIKESGFGKEGPRYVVEETTELKTVVFHDTLPGPAP
jgi:acyl-CoA reductase-like NAD-dependent aldehyde dehydrogenase